MLVIFIPLGPSCIIPMVDLGMSIPKVGERNSKPGQVTECVPISPARPAHAGIPLAWLVCGAQEWGSRSVQLLLRLLSSGEWGQCPDSPLNTTSLFSQRTIVCFSFFWRSGCRGTARGCVMGRS